VTCTSPIALPLKVNGDVRYGLSTSATLTRESSSFVEHYLPDLLQAADAMEKLLVARA